MLKLKSYHPSEERLNIWTHAAAAMAAIPGLWWMLKLSRTTVEIFASAVYCFSMMVLFACSAFYHAAKTPNARLLLRRADHAAIYFLISGTYTPLFLSACGGMTAAVILSISWGIAVIGIAKELLNFRLPKYVSIISYLVSGWLCVFAAHKLIENMSGTGLILLLTGGVAYTAGVPFYLNRRKYSHAIWHIFVIAGVLFHYSAVLTLFK